MCVCVLVMKSGLLTTVTHTPQKADTFLCTLYTHSACYVRILNTIVVNLLLL